MPTATKTKNKITSFEDACVKLNRNPLALPDVSMIDEELRKFILANYKLAIITEAINDGKKANWNNSNEYKYYPWFYIDADADRPAGFGFSDSGFHFRHSLTAVGSRLTFRTSEDAMYAAKQFEDLYKDLILY